MPALFRHRLLVVGEIDILAGIAELLPHTLGEIRIQGHLKVGMHSECDRCLEPAEFPIDSDFDLFYRPAERAGYEEDVLDQGMKISRSATNV